MTFIYSLMDPQNTDRFVFSGTTEASSQLDKSLLTVNDKYMSDRGQLNSFVKGKKKHTARCSKDSEVAQATI